METVALLIAPVGGLLLGLVVYLVAVREAKRDLPAPADKPSAGARR
jgi:hypothetical protein